MCRYELRVDYVTTKVHEKIVYESLFIPTIESVHESDEVKQTETYCALVKTTAIDSELHRSKLGAITKAKFGAVILVANCTLSSRKSCRKLITKRITLRLIVGKRRMMDTEASASFD